MNPDGVQRLLNQADWQSEQVMKVLRTHVMEQIGSQEGVLLVDETGFLKKGDEWTYNSSNPNEMRSQVRMARSGREFNGNIVAQPVDSLMPLPVDQLLLTGICICPKTGSRISSGAIWQAWQSKPNFLPNQN